MVTATYDAGTVHSAASTSVTPARAHHDHDESDHLDHGGRFQHRADHRGDRARARRDTLPVTGSADTTWLAELALLVICMGSLLIVASRRRLSRR